jgi:hypothetical protein
VRFAKRNVSEASFLGLTAVKRQRTIKVGYLQMDMTDANLGMNRSFTSHALSVI